MLSKICKVYLVLYSMVIQVILGYTLLPPNGGEDYRPPFQYLSGLLSIFPDVGGVNNPNHSNPMIIKISNSMKISLRVRNVFLFNFS